MLGETDVLTETGGALSGETVTLGREARTTDVADVSAWVLHEATAATDRARAATVTQ
jgi:hypothetical protein